MPIFWHFEGYLRVRPRFSTTPAGKMRKITFTAQQVQRVKNYFEDEPEAHISQALYTPQLSYGLTRRILWKQLQ